MTDLTQIYLRAADVIRTNKHYQGDYFTFPEASVGIGPERSRCPVCVVGALSVAVYGDPVPPILEGGGTDFELAIDALAKGLGPVPGSAAGVPGDAIGRLAVWNDAPERTGDEVIAVLVAAAQLAAAVQAVA